MRAFALPTPGARCGQCWLPQGWCICPTIPIVPTRTEIVIVRHHIEAWRPTGTARLATLALPRSRIIELGRNSAEVDRTIAELDDTWLLYPGGNQREALGASPQRLLLLDGSWRQARRMFLKLPALRGLPQLSLPIKSEPVRRLRVPRHPAERSTLESIADALEILEDEGVSAPLRDLHARFVESSLRVRGTW